MANQTNRGIPISKVDPRYLHTNSTSHTWPFSAIAELIDNAYDPDVKAKQFWIDKSEIKGEDCLIFMDNGAGLDYDKMHKMLSFGFNKKRTINGHVPIGMYGNGFKSGSMRLGRDAIVLSKKAKTICVGLLSQTYLEKTKAENVIVPIALFKVSEQSNLEPDCDLSLEDILKHSLFNTKEELLEEINAISGPSGKNLSGTRIIIWNLRRTSSGELEFNFTHDRYDIRIPVEMSESSSEQNKRLWQDTSLPESKYSLRAYTRILYLKPRMQIIIRGQKVKTELISKSLALILEDKYKPTFLKQKRNIKMTFGYNTKNKEHYGIMMYHKNRLIRAYQRVTCQDKASRKGVGVIGVIECNYLNPTHNKQEFDNTDEYKKTMQNLNTKLEEYWKQIQHEYRNCPKLVEDIVEKPDQNWVQCDECLKWRKLPDGIDNKRLPEQWFCRQNPDPQYRSCLIVEEAEDSEDEQPKNPKTYKQHEKKKKLQIQRRQMFSSPMSPTQATTSSDPHVRSRTRTSNNLPVISDVTSLAATPSRNKRSLGPNRETGDLKRARISDRFADHAPDSLPPSTSPSVDCSLSIALISDSDETDDNEITEDCSTHRLEQETAAFDIANMLTVEFDNTEEPEIPGGNDAVVAMDTSTSASSSEPAEHVSMSTQTVHQPAIKQEAKDSESQKEDVWRKGEERENQLRAVRDSSSVETRPNLESLQEPGAQDESGTAVIPDGKLACNANQTSCATVLPEAEARPQSSGRAEESTLTVQEAQQQQDRLMELLEEVGKERDESQAQQQLLVRKVEELQNQLKLTRSEMKTQTPQTSSEGTQDYKVLYLEAKEENKQLQHELNEMKTRMREDQKKNETLLKERDEKLERLEKENRALSVSCESLRKDLEEAKRKMEQLRVSASQEAQAAAAPAEASTSGREFGTQQEVPEMKTEHVNSTDRCRLKELRQKVARLLITFVPALDLQQVNYDCEVIDEILSQVIDEISVTETPSSIT